MYPTLFVALVLIAFAELQPIAAYHFTATWSWLTASAAFTNVDYVVYALLGVGALTGAWILRPSQGAEQPSGRGRLVLVGLVGPVALWLVVLLLTHWTLCRPPDAVSDAVYEALDRDEPNQAKPWYASVRTLARAVGLKPDQIEGRVSPSMCFGRAEKLDNAASSPHGEGLGLPPGAQLVLYVYAMVALLALLYCLLFLNVNHTSLHRYYRDRLSAAYLFKRAGDGERLVANDAQPLDGLGDDECVGPYHLINAALNVSKGTSASESSDAGGGERPGQRVDHFLFSMLAVGSDLTGYCDARKMRTADRHVNLGTAMAISGAAASPRGSIP